MVSRQGLTITWWAENITRTCRHGMYCSATSDPECPDGRTKQIAVPDGREWTVCEAMRKYPGTSNPDLQVRYISPRSCTPHHGFYAEGFCSPTASAALVAHRLFGDERCSSSSLMFDVTNPPCSAISPMDNMGDAHCPAHNGDTIERVYNSSTSTSPTHTTVSTTDSFFFRYECGACKAWKTKRLEQRYCDPPNRRSDWAVNLTHTFGPQCRSSVAEDSCCFQPLAYSGGPPYGTPCSKACGDREGDDDSYCGWSDGSHYGNCFCGPMKQCKRWASMSVEQPFCDAPGSGSAWAVDLSKGFGPQCNTTAASASACCYAPLGYDGGPEYGTPCSKVCQVSGGRAGRDTAYCAMSDGSEYGNCFCGPHTR